MITVEAFRLRNARERWKDGKCYAWSSFVKLLESEKTDLCYLDEITTDLMSRALGKATENGIEKTTQQGYLKHMMSSLRWAAKLGLLPSAPSKPPLKVPTRRKKMRSRPITLEEYERVYEYAEKHHPEMAPVLQVCFLGGLRIDEASRLSQDWTQDFVIDLNHEPPLWRIKAEGHKSGRDETLPVPPELVRYLKSREWPAKGRMFRDVPSNRDTLGKKVAKIGKKVGVIVNGKGKRVTAQDLRRSYGTRLAKVLAPAELMRMMRHADIKTTMDYYVDIEMDHLATKLRQIDDEKGGAKGGAKTGFPKNVAKTAEKTSERQDLNLRSQHPQSSDD